MSDDVLSDALKNSPQFKSRLGRCVLFGFLGLLGLLVSVTFIATAYFAEFGTMVTNLLYLLGFIGLGFTYSMATGAIEQFTAAKKVAMQIKADLLHSAKS